MNCETGTSRLGRYSPVKHPPTSTLVSLGLVLGPFVPDQSLVLLFLLTTPSVVVYGVTDSPSRINCTSLVLRSKEKV